MLGAVSNTESRALYWVGAWSDAHSKKPVLCSWAQKLVRILPAVHLFARETFKKAQLNNEACSISDLPSWETFAWIYLAAVRGVKVRNMFDHVLQLEHHLYWKEDGCTSDGQRDTFINECTLGDVNLDVILLLDSPENLTTNIKTDTFKIGSQLKQIEEDSGSLEN